MNSKAKVPAETPMGDYGDRRLRFNWNDDTVTEIVPWLPAKSIARFKSVCKHWLSLFSSEKFRHLHTLCHPKLQPSLILKMPTLQFFYFDPIMNGGKLMIPYSFSVPNPRIVCSCNGLMLLQSDHPETNYYMYNPATKQSREISVTNTHSENDPYIVTLALAFDPSKSPHYQIVCIRSTTEAGTDPYEIHTYLIEVYDSESRTWKLSLGPFMFPRKLFISNNGGVYWNGSIYWEILNESGYYDIAKNVFETLALPNYPSIEYQGIMSTSAFYLQEANDHLYQSRLVTEGNYQLVTLFELQVDDDRSRWLLKYHNIISQYQPTSALSCPRQLRFIKGSYGTETCCLVSLMSGKISVYNFLDKSSMELVDLTVQPFYQEDANEEFDLEWYEFGECLALV